MSRALLALLLLTALPVDAERVRVIVSLTPEALVADAEPRPDILRGLAVPRGVDWWGRTRTFSVDIEDTEIETLASDPRVRALFVDTGGEGAMRESLNVIGIEPIRAAGLDGEGMTVAVFDTGIDRTNPDFEGRIVDEQCFCDNLDGTGCCPDGTAAQSGPGSAADDHGHGTHVAGIIASGGRSAPAGIAPAAGIIAVKVMDHRNSFRSFTQIFRALAWLIEKHPEVDVINMSLGSHALMAPEACEESALAQGLSEAVETLRSRGVLITASSGNQGSLSGTTFPACLGSVLAVAATYDSPGSHQACAVSPAALDDVTCFSNSTASVDLVAPGATIGSARIGGGTIDSAGTSMAAPHVAGTLALMRQVNAELGADDAERILEESGYRVIDWRNGLVFPRLNASAAVAAVPHAESPSRRRSVPQ
jgi:subtilisin family serine protease